MTGSLHERQPPAFTATGFVYRTLTGFPHHRACLLAVLTGDTMQLMQKLDAIIQRLYEDNLDGKISDDRFAKMTASYEQEQTELEARVAELHDLMEAAKAKSDGIESFLKIVRGRTEITELTPTIIREFVDRIYVHHAVDFEGQRIQQIDVAWNFIGIFDSPESDIEATKGKSA